jgi:sulfoxide reductase heme-binding subunit YedZ
MRAVLTGFGWQRMFTHLALALFTLAGCAAVHLLYVPYADVNYVLTIGCGYLALIWIMLSLVIGPFKLFARRRNPVNINLRRDVGIWAGLTGCIHVWCALQVRYPGKILLYFFHQTRTGYHLLLNLFGLSNDAGLIATIILIGLLIISNDLSLRRLKGRRWKYWQRYNYLLFGLVILHTFAYQSISRRETPFVIAAVMLTILTLTAQAIGFYLYRSRPLNRCAA